MTIDFETPEPHLAVVTIDRPEVRNALGADEFAGLSQAWLRIENDPAIWAAVITGAGDVAFCAGHDLRSGMAEMGPPTDVLTGVLKDFPISKALVAAVNGYCVAGGMELLLGTDIRLAVPDAEFGLAEVRWGLYPGGGGALKLPRQIPYAKAMELLLLGGRISAKDALECGLVNRIVAREALMSEAMDVARALTRNGPLAVQAIKRVVHRTHGLPTSLDTSIETQEISKVFISRDAKEGPLAFVEKREPHYTGR